MNEFEKEEFINRISGIPVWAKDFDGLKKFAMHLSYRLVQSNMHANELSGYIKTFHPEIHKQIFDKEDDKIFKKSRELDDIYNNMPDI